MESPCYSGGIPLEMKSIRDNFNTYQGTSFLPFDIGCLFTVGFVLWAELSHEGGGLFYVLLRTGMRIILKVLT